MSICDLGQPASIQLYEPKLWSQDEFDKRTYVYDQILLGQLSI